MHRALLPLLASALVLVGAGGSRAAEAPRYYLALGDSLAAGTQPGQLIGREGYADQLTLLERARIPGLELVDIACPGETSTAFRRGGRCPYPQRNQLAQATAFLRAHRGEVAFITIDIGSNDFLSCRKVQTRCTVGAFATVRRNLPPILRALHAAAGDEVPIAGMDYYDPFVVEWLHGTSGKVTAAAHVAVVAAGNALVRKLYGRGHARVAHVERAFEMRNFRLGAGRVPRNVANVCRLTWMCARGNKHPNRDGYGVIARAFAAALS